MDTQQYYLVDIKTGRLRFTPKGRQKLGSLFGFAGIELSSVRTQEDYRQAALRVRQAVQGMASRQFAQTGSPLVSLDPSSPDSVA